MAADVNARGKIAQFHRSCGREIRLLSFLPESELRAEPGPERKNAGESGEINGVVVLECALITIRFAL